jgi:predicted PurR-regulated permease PerM
LLGFIGHSGAALVGFIMNLVLVPIITLYLLIDWKTLLDRIHGLIPRAYEKTVAQLATQSNTVLSGFLRGQFLVMLSLGIIYSVGLKIIGLEYAILIGMIAGLLSFVPYLGFIVGLLIAGVAMFLQMPTWSVMPMFYVLIVFGIGQIVESVLLTPWLVGDRIGLHPVAVIFAVMAGGHLFGFTGVLLALPIAAVIVVLLRYAHEQYVKSSVYDESNTT